MGAADYVVKKTNALVQKIVRVVDKRENQLCRMWYQTYGLRVVVAHGFLVASIMLSAFLTTISVWLYLYNEFGRTSDIRRSTSSIFARLVSCGCATPFLVIAGYSLWHRRKNTLSERNSTNAKKHVLQHRNSTVSAFSSVSQQHFSNFLCCNDWFSHARAIEKERQSERRSSFRQSTDE